MRSKVDLPAPEGPMMPMNAPSGIARFTLSTAAFAPNRRDTPSNANIGQSSPAA